MNKKLLFLLLFISSNVFAQDAEFFKPHPVRRKAAAVKITTSLHIDGVLNEPEWCLALHCRVLYRLNRRRASSAIFKRIFEVFYNRYLKQF